MSPNCLNIINLFKDLLSKEREFYNYLNINNTEELKNTIKDINIIKNSIEIIFDKYIKERIKFQELYKTNFANFYKKTNFYPPNFKNVRIPEKPNDDFEYKLLFIDPRIVRNETMLLEEIRNNTKDKDGNNISVNQTIKYFIINQSMHPKRMYAYNNRPYTIWVRDIKDSFDDDSMRRPDDKDNSISYNDIYTEDENGNEIPTNKYINPITKKPYIRDDFMSFGEYLILFADKYREGVKINTSGFTKFCALLDNGFAPMICNKKEGLNIDCDNKDLDLSIVCFRIAISIE